MSYSTDHKPINLYNDPITGQDYTALPTSTTFQFQNGAFWTLQGDVVSLVSAPPDNHGWKDIIDALMHGGVTTPKISTVVSASVLGGSFWIGLQVHNGKVLQKNCN